MEAACRIRERSLDAGQRGIGADHRPIVTAPDQLRQPLDVNAIKEKQQPNMRAAGSDNTVKLTPARKLSLEHALEFIASDECVEVTPKHIRLRKVHLDHHARVKAARAAS